MPPIDSAMSVFVLFLAVVFIALFSVFIMSLLFPFMLKYWEPLLNNQNVYQSLFLRSPVLESWEYMRHYGAYFSPFLIGLTGLFVCILISPENPAGWGVPAGFALGLLIEFLYLKGRNDYKTIASCLFNSFSASLISLVWILFASLLIAPWFDSYFTPTSRLAATLFFVAIVFLHIFLNTFFSIRKQLIVVISALAVFSLCIAIVFQPGASVLCGKTLRFLRLGGGVPITVFLKSAQSNIKTESASVNPKSESVTGCLILVTGAEVLVSPPSPGQDCQQEPSPLRENPNTRIPIYVYERSDIRRTEISPAQPPIKKDQTK